MKIGDLIKLNTIPYLHSGDPDKQWNLTALYLGKLESGGHKLLPVGDPEPIIIGSELLQWAKVIK